MAKGHRSRNDGKAKESAVNPPRGFGPDHTAADVRFTTKGETLYAIALGTPPDGKITIKSLAAKSPLYQGEIGVVEQLGGGKVPFTRDESGLTATIAATAGRQPGRRLEAHSQTITNNRKTLQGENRT